MQKQQNLVRLDSIPLVMLQFSFSNPRIVPHFIRRKEPQKEEEMAQKKQSSGKLIIEPIPNMSLYFFPAYLNANGYELTDAFYQTRFRDDRPYHLVRYIFCHQENLKISEEFRKIQKILLGELQELCSDALWRVRIFLNPFFEKGQEVAGQYALSINLEARQPLFHGDGRRVMIRTNDDQTEGKLIPLQPSYFICIKDNSILFVKNNNSQEES